MNVLMREYPNKKRINYDASTGIHWLRVVLIFFWKKVLLLMKRWLLYCRFSFDPHSMIQRHPFECIKHKQAPCWTKWTIFNWTNTVVYVNIRVIPHAKQKINKIVKHSLKKRICSAFTQTQITLKLKLFCIQCKRARLFIFIFFSFSFWFRWELFFWRIHILVRMRA